MQQSRWSDSAGWSAPQARVEEAVEGVRDIVGPGAAITGFYSYGEISPFTPKARCELHNQTMTVTTLSER